MQNSEHSSTVSVSLGLVLQSTTCPRPALAIVETLTLGHVLFTVLTWSQSSLQIRLSSNKNQNYFISSKTFFSVVLVFWHQSSWQYLSACQITVSSPTHIFLHVRSLSAVQHVSFCMSDNCQQSNTYLSACQITVSSPTCIFLHVR